MFHFLRKILNFWAMSLKFVLGMYFDIFYLKMKKFQKKSQVFFIFWLENPKIGFWNLHQILKNGLHGEKMWNLGAHLGN